jgi:hypothetical protein
MSFFTNLSNYRYELNNIGGFNIRDMQTGRFVGRAIWGVYGDLAVHYLKQMHEAECAHYNNTKQEEDMTVDQYNDNVWTYEWEDENKKDVLGDLPDYSDMTLEEYIAQYWYRKTEYAEDGCIRLVPTRMKKELIFQDGGARGKTQWKGDAVSDALNSLAWSESSMLKVATPKMVEKIRDLLSKAAESDVDQTSEILKHDALDLMMEEKRENWINSARTKMDALDELEPKVINWLGHDTRRMDIFELFTRVVAYADKVNEKSTEYDYRRHMGTKLFKAVQDVLYVPTGWNMPKFVGSYIGKLYWARLTNKLHADVEKAALEIVQPNEALEACAGRYTYAILNQIQLDRGEL